MTSLILKKKNSAQELQAIYFCKLHARFISPECHLCFFLRLDFAGEKLTQKTAHKHLERSQRKVPQMNNCSALTLAQQQVTNSYC